MMLLHLSYMQSEWQDFSSIAVYSKGEVRNDHQHQMSCHRGRAKRKRKK